MSRGNSIVIESNPKGKMAEALIGDTSLPGTIMQVKAATVAVSGEFTYIAAAPGTDGFDVGVCVLREDYLQGFPVTQAYVSGTRCQLYWPLPGEEVNVLWGEVAGTGNTCAIGDRFIIDAESGLIVPETGAPESTIFVALEAQTQKAGGTLLWVMRI